MKQEIKMSKFATERTTKRKKPLDHLARDVLAAQAAGLSYGNYKAKHPHTGEDSDEPEELTVDPSKKVLICIRCKKTFLAPKYAANKAYCSDECKARAYRERDQERNPDKYMPKPCPVCGKLVQRDRGRVYCSVECKTVAERNNARERERRKREKEKGKKRKGATV